MTDKIQEVVSVDGGGQCWVVAHVTLPVLLNIDDIADVLQWIMTIPIYKGDCRAKLKLAWCHQVYYATTVCLWHVAMRKLMRFQDSQTPTRNARLTVPGLLACRLSYVQASW